MCTYDSQTSADFWHEKKSCRRLAVVGESGKRNVHLQWRVPMTARPQLIFDPRQKVADVCPWWVSVRVSPLTMKCTYDGQTSADFWPETKSCQRLAVVGQKGRLESGRWNVIPLTMTCTYDGQTSANFWPEKKSCRRLAVVGESGRRKGESTYNDVYLGRSDVSRFLTQDKTHSNLEDWQLLGLKININVGSILREKLWDVWESVLFEKNDMMN